MIFEWYRARKAEKLRQRQIELIREFCCKCTCNIGCTVTPEELIEGKTCAWKILCESMGLR